MRNINNPRHKLTASQVQEAQRLYEDCGWRVNWISVYFHIHRSSVIFHARFNGWVRRIKTAKRIPDEIAEIYRDRKKSKYEQKMKGSYEYIKQSAEQQRIKSCGHVRWVKRCSLCGEILSSDAICERHEAFAHSNATAQSGQN